jgi:succinoglycan biosynthesis protein ExoA
MSQIGGSGRPTASENTFVDSLSNSPSQSGQSDAAVQPPSAGAVLVVIPSFNEADHIEGLVATLLRDMDRLNSRIVIADGGSTDATCAIVRRLGEQDSRVLLLDCKKRIAASINDAVDKYGENAEFLIRIDAHAMYPPEYCERLLHVQAETGADSVVVSMLTEGGTCFQRAAAAAQNSFLGNGGSPHRNTATGRWVEHGHHALMRIAAYKSVGGYDESFLWNEDAELDARLRAAGFRIYLAGTPSIVYFPRRSFAALFRQYFNYGRGRASNFLKHGERLRLRQMLPLAVAPAMAMLALAPISAAFVAPLLAWCSVCLGYGLWLGTKVSDRCAAGAGIAAIAMHSGWSFGFLFQLWQALLRSLTGTGTAQISREIETRGR